MFFGGGVRMEQGVNSWFTDRFPDKTYSYLLQAGAGDYPLVAEIQYGVEKADGRAAGFVSGRGAALTAYEAQGLLRIYLFWKHPRVRHYFSFGVSALQEEMVSAGQGHESIFEYTDGIRFGFSAGWWLDIALSEGFFTDIGLTYRNINSDLFGYREMIGLVCKVNVGR